MSQEISNNIQNAIDNRDYYELEELWVSANSVQRCVIEAAMKTLEDELEENGC